MAKFPLFRSLPEENFKLVTIADMSKGVMALLVDLAYGLDRFSHLSRRSRGTCWLQRLRQREAGQKNRENLRGG